MTGAALPDTTELDFRIELIRDALNGITYHLPRPKLFVLPFVDYLYLLFQRPLVFNFWEGAECVFTSLEDQYFRELLGEGWPRKPSRVACIPKTNLEVSVHSFDSPAINNAYVRRQRSASSTEHNTEGLPVDEDATAIVERLCAAELSPKLLPEMFKILAESVRVPRHGVGKCVIDGAKEADYRNQLLPLLDPMRRVLKSAFGDALDSPGIRQREGGFCRTNIYAVVRTIAYPQRRYRHAFPYTAGLLLMDDQRDEARERCRHLAARRGEMCHASRTSDFDCCRQLEQPLGLDARSVSDLVFCSGTVDFGRSAGEADWDVAGGEVDKLRQICERCVYPPGRGLFYVPVHVCGTPWIAVFTFADKWSHNYTLYRDVLHKTAALIRQNAWREYITLVTDKLILRLRDPAAPSATVVKEVNRDWRLLAQTYPFPSAELHQSRGEESAMRVPGRGPLTVTARENPFFNRQVDWGIVGEASVVDACGEAVARFAAGAALVEISAVAHTSHVLKVPLRVLQAICATEMDRATQMRVMQQQVDRILGLHSFALACIDSRKRAAVVAEMTSLDEFQDVVRRAVVNTTEFLSVPQVSGNRAARIRDIVRRDSIGIGARGEVVAPEARVRYYPSLVSLALDGLISNALDYMDELAPNIGVFLSTKAVAGRTFVQLDVENSTDLAPDVLADTIERMNAASPGMVGITVLFWACRIWAPPATDEYYDYQPVWTKSTSSCPTLIVASLPIAEVVG